MPESQCGKTSVKRDASGKKGKLLCCKRIFDRIKANLAEIQPKNHQNVQKRIFCKKLQESMGKVVATHSISNWLIICS